MTGPSTAELTGTLVAHLRRGNKPPLVFTEIALEGSWGDKGRLDVVAVQIGTGYSSWNITGYEIKASRSDFTRDVDSGKWRQYLGVCDRLFFAAPSAVIAKGDVPDPAGLLTFKNDSWQTVKRAQHLEGYGKGPGLDAALRLLRRADDLDRNPPSQARGRLARMEMVAAYEREQDLAYHLSAKARRLILDAQRVEENRERARHQIEQERTRLLADVEAARQLGPLLDGVRKILDHAVRAIPTRFAGSDPALHTEAILSLAADLDARYRHGMEAGR